MSQFIAYPERYEHDDDYGPHDPKDARAAKWSMRIGAAVGMGAIASGLAASIYLIVEVSEGSSNNELRAQQINTQLKEQGYTPGIVGISLVQKRSFEYLGKNPLFNFNHGDIRPERIIDVCPGL